MLFPLAKWRIKHFSERNAEINMKWATLKILTQQLMSETKNHLVFGFFLFALWFVDLSLAMTKKHIFVVNGKPHQIEYWFRVPISPALSIIAHKTFSPPIQLLCSSFFFVFSLFSEWNFHWSLQCDAVSHQWDQNTNNYHIQINAHNIFK